MRRVSFVLAMCLLVSAGCGSPAGSGASDDGSGAGDQDSPSATARPATSPSQPRRSTRPTVGPTRSPSPSGFGELTAVPCNGRPSADQVIAVLRRSSVLAASARPAVTTGPLCAGTWQYTVLSPAELDQLHVVTRGAPQALVIETAGTNPCTAQVRANAPAGIVAAIRC